jgi:UDP-N-acetylglucosamine 2-epimerase (non-hydrolysing)
VVDRIRIACVIGTRPEAIKMAPVVKVLRESAWAECAVVATAQHRGLLDQALSHFQIAPDIDLDMMTEGQSMVGLISRLLPALADAIDGLKVDAVLAQGDTASVFVAALVAYYANIPFGHVEAGLRTHDLREPFPEEGYRQMVARLARWHFAPTDHAAANLRLEGIGSESIFVTGNTGIDALLATSAIRAAAGHRRHPGCRRLILLTAHRRENFGAPMGEVFTAVRRLVESRADVEVVYPVHPNPNVRHMAEEILGGHPRINLSEPLDYVEFVGVMADCHLILTDSGGIQEEAPALGKPVLVLREQSERPEALSAGVARLVGTDASRIFRETTRLLDDAQLYQSMVIHSSPFGDGKSAARIAEILRIALTR